MISSSDKYKILFIGRKTKSKRGGRKVFLELFERFPDNLKELIDLPRPIKPFASYFIFYLVNLVSIGLIVKRDKNIKVIVTQYNDIREVVCALVGKFASRKVFLVGAIYHIESKIDYREKKKFNDVLLKLNHTVSNFLMVHFFDLIFTESTFVKEQINNHHNSIFVAASGVKEENFSKDFIEENQLESRDIDILFFGAMNPLKGIYDLLWALKGTVIAGIKPKVVLAGFCEEFELRAIRKEIDRCEVQNNVSMFTNISEEFKFELFKRSKLYVLPSYYEGIPITFFEAMASGCVILTYFLNNYKDIKKNIIFVDRGDKNGLKSKIEEILKDYKSYYSAFAVKNFLYSMNHSSDRVADLKISEILKLVEKKDTVESH